MLHSLCKFWNKIEEIILVLLFALMLVASILKIILRFLPFNIDSDVLNTFSSAMVLWLALWGALVAAKESKNITIDVISRYAKSKASKRWIAGITTLIACSICGVLAVVSAQFVLEEFELGTIAFSKVPSWLVAIVIPLAMTLMSLRYFVGLISLFWTHEE